MDFSLSEEQLMIQRTAKEFREREVEPIAVELEQSARLPDSLIKKEAEAGFFGMLIPKKYGGSELGGLAHLLVIEQLAYSGTGAWWPVGFNNSIPSVIVRFGTKELIEKYVTNCFDGTKMYSVQFTEPDTGSDPRALTTTAVPSGDAYVINGTKRFSTFGARDGYCTLYAKDDEGNCTCFVIEKNLEGYTAPKIWELMGSGGMEAADIHYQNYRVAKENILGEKGKGFPILLHWIASEKVEGCAAAIGLAQAALDESLKYTKSRMVRGRAMTDLQGIRWMLADMYTRIEPARWLTYKAGWLEDRDYPNFEAEAAACKLFVQPAMSEVMDIAMRLHGAYGYTKEFKIERLYRAQPGNIVISVSLEINKSMVGGAIAHRGQV